MVSPWEAGVVGPWQSCGVADVAGGLDEVDCCGCCAVDGTGDGKPPGRPAPHLLHDTQSHRLAGHG